MKAVKFNYTGLMCPVFTGFANDSSRTIRYDVIDKYASWLKQRGIKGALVNGTTGEGVCQRFDERKRNFEEWLKASRKYDLKCMVQVGGAGLTTVHDLAEHAEEKGADAVLCLPELFFKPTCEEDLVDYLRKVAEHCPTRPLFYYHFPAFSKVNLSMPRLCDLAEQHIPTFNGIKFTSNDLNEGVACLKPGRKVFLGSNTLFLGALAQGFDSGILVSLNVFPEYAQEILAAVQQNRWADAQAAQLKLTKRFNECGAALKDEFNRVNKDFECGPARKPLLNLNKNSDIEIGIRFKNGSIIVFYLVGLAIGLLINILVIEIVTKHEKNATFHVGNIRFKPVSEILSEQNEPKISVEDVKKIKILCFLNTSPRNHKFRAVHIQALWGKHCDKLFFASTLTDINIGAIGFNVTDNHDSMWGKEKLMLKFLYNNFINDYDWFYKGDDDTFALVENLRFLVSAYSHDDPIYFGYKFKNPSTKWGYFSGGGGYAMSRKAVRVFVEQVLTNQEFFRRNNEKRSVCHIETDLEVEDIHISVCLDNYNVYAGDSRDLVKRDRFFLWWPGVHLMGKPAWNTWYWDWKYYFNEEGLNCCSNYSVAFHYVHSQRQYGMYFLAYRLQTFGIKRRFPPPPKKKVFSEVAEQLNNERFNITYRGFFKGFNESKREN